MGLMGLMGYVGLGNSQTKKFDMRIVTLIVVLVFLAGCGAPNKPETQKMKALIVDGQNNHGIWPKTTMMMKRYLEETGMFQVDIARTAFTWQGPHNDPDPGLGEENRKLLLEKYPLPDGKKTESRDKSEADPNFKPDFSQYQLVISNFGWTAAPWPAETQAALEKFVSGGGGLIIIHAANNSFPEWAAYNEMIGLGGWGDRDEKSGPYVYYDQQNQLVRDTTAGPAGSHGYQSEFVVTLRDTLHPITKGMPSAWMHASDEMYDRLRGPAKNLSILATAYSDIEKNASFFSPLKGTNRHEPMAMVLTYGKGRVFHTPLGHADYSMECVGFITLLQRGAEWVATGAVTQPLPSDFPTAGKSSSRKWGGVSSQ